MGIHDDPTTPMRGEVHDLVVTCNLGGPLSPTIFDKHRSSIQKATYKIVNTIESHVLISTTYELHGTWRLSGLITDCTPDPTVFLELTIQEHCPRRTASFRCSCFESWATTGNTSSAGTHDEAPAASLTTSVGIIGGGQGAQGGNHPVLPPCFKYTIMMPS